MVGLQVVVQADGSVAVDLVYTYLSTRLSLSVLML